MVNKELLSKFAELFKSGSLIDITKTIFCGRIIMNALNINIDKYITYSELEETFNEIINDRSIDDTKLVDGLLKLDSTDLALIPLDMIAEVVSSNAFKTVEHQNKIEFTKKLNQSFNIFDAFQADPTDVVFHSASLRKIIYSLPIQQQHRDLSLSKIDKSISDFKSITNDEIFYKDKVIYRNVWSAGLSIDKKMRLSDIQTFGKTIGNSIADARDASLQICKTQEERLAVQSYHINAHDKTRLAIIDAFNKNPEDYPNLFLAENVDGSNKENKHVFPRLASTFGTTIVQSAAFSVGLTLLKAVPGVGPFAASMVIGTMTAGSLVKEVLKAHKLAKSQNRHINKQEYLNIGINVGTAIIPYVFGGVVGSIVMGAKTFGVDIINKKANLSLGSHLTAKDVLSSFGMAATKGAAMYVGRMLGSWVGNHAVEDITNFFADKPIQSNEIDFSNARKDTAKEITKATSGKTEMPDDKALAELRSHKFELTDNARSTANPDNNKMWQDGSQKDWYDKTSYDKAVNVLHRAGISDADGALRNLGSGMRFEQNGDIKGNEYTNALKDLLSGNLSGNTARAILGADKVIDNTGDLIAHTQGQSFSKNSISNVGQGHLPESIKNLQTNVYASTETHDTGVNSGVLPDSIKLFSISEFSAKDLKPVENTTSIQTDANIDAGTTLNSSAGISSQVSQQTPLPSSIQNFVTHNGNNIQESKSMSEEQGSGLSTEELLDIIANRKMNTKMYDGNGKEVLIDSGNWSEELSDETKNLIHSLMER